MKVVGVNILIDVKMDIKVENVGDGIVIKVDKEDQIFVIEVIEKVSVE